MHTENHACVRDCWYVHYRHCAFGTHWAGEHVLESACIIGTDKHWSGVTHPHWRVQAFKRRDTHTCRRVHAFKREVSTLIQERSMLGET